MILGFWDSDPRVYPSAIPTLFWLTWIDAEEVWLGARYLTPSISFLFDRAIFGGRTTLTGIPIVHTRKNQIRMKYYHLLWIILFLNSLWLLMSCWLEVKVCCCWLLYCWLNCWCCWGCYSYPIDPCCCWCNKSPGLATVKATNAVIYHLSWKLLLKNVPNFHKQHLPRKQALYLNYKRTSTTLMLYDKILTLFIHKVTITNANSGKLIEITDDP